MLVIFYSLYLQEEELKDKVAKMDEVEQQLTTLKLGLKVSIYVIISLRSWLLSDLRKICAVT